MGSIKRSARPEAESVFVEHLHFYFLKGLASRWGGPVRSEDRSTKINVSDWSPEIVLRDQSLNIWRSLKIGDQTSIQTVSKNQRPEIGLYTSVFRVRCLNVGLWRLVSKDQCLKIGLRIISKIGVCLNIGLQTLISEVWSVDTDF